MDHLNNLTLTGVLEREPLRVEHDSLTQVRFTVRHEGQNAKTGELFKLYVPCEAFGVVAERALTLRPGAVVGVEGRLKWRSYVDQGEKKGSLAVWVRQLSVMTSGEGED
jgi:single-stranded DNA-binding protein